jgi:hypothetical protein
MTRATAACWVAVLSLAALCAVAGYRTAHPRLAASLARSLADALHVPPESVQIGEATLGAPATLRLERVAFGPLRAESIAVTLDPLDALGSHARPRRIEARGLAAGARLRLATVDAHLDRATGKGRITAHGLEFERAGVPLFISELGVELEGRRVARIGFAGAALGQAPEARGHRAFVDALAGTAVREPGGDGAWKLRAARPGLVITGRFQAGTLTARADLERLALGPLAPVIHRGALDLRDALATGALTIHVTPDELSLRGQLALAQLTVEHPTLAPRPIGPLALTLAGELRTVPGMISVEDLEITLGPAAITLTARAARTGDFDVEAHLYPSGCAELLRALPRSLVPTLDGLSVTGRLAGRTRLAGSLAHLGDLHLGVDLDVGCQVLADPPLADPHALLAGTVPHTVDGRAFPLGPANPSWRALPSLPLPIVRTFLAAEDDRFFLHHGFDLSTIRRALAADLAVGRPARGASTLTQQLVKNLFLSGERTAGRKLEEAVLTWRLEQVVGKRRVLELYLNLVELGPGIHGIAEGSERYFGKEPDQLSVDEAAQLAALLPAPRRGMDAAWQRRYQALKARLPSENPFIPEGAMQAGAPAVKLTRR